MILEIYGKDGSHLKVSCVFCAAVMRSKPDELYYQTRRTRKGHETVREHFVPLSLIAGCFVTPWTPGTPGLPVHHQLPI